MFWDILALNSKHTYLQHSKHKQSSRFAVKTIAPLITNRLQPSFEQT